MKYQDKKKYRLSTPEILSLMDYIEQEGQMKWSQIDRMLVQHIADITLFVYDYGNSKVVTLPYCTIATHSLVNIYDEKLVSTFIWDVLKCKVECIYSNVDKFLETKESAA